MKSVAEEISRIKSVWLLVIKSMKPFDFESSTGFLTHIESSAAKSAGQVQHAGAPESPPFPQVQWRFNIVGYAGGGGDLGEGGPVWAEGTRHFLKQCTCC